MAKRRRLPPPSNTPVKNLMGLTIYEYVVGSWCPTQDATGPKTAVCIELKTYWQEEIPLSLFLRLKTPESVDQMIQALLRHKRDVWPDSR